MTFETQISSGAQVAKGTSYLFLQGLVGNTSALLFLTIASRILPISDIGATSALGIIATLFMTIGSFAIPSGVTKYLSEYIGKGRQDVAKQIYKKTLQFGFLAGITVSLVCFMSSAITSQLFIGDASLQPIIVILALDVFFLVFNSFLIGILFGLQKFGVIAFVGIAVSSLKFFASLYFIIIGLGLLGVILGWVTGDIAGCFLSFFFASSRFGKAKSFEGFSFAELVRYSLPLYGASIAAYFSATIDKLVILSLSNLAVLGIYTVAIAAVNAIGIVSSSIGSSLFPQFAQMYGRYGAHALKEASIKASRYVFLIFTPLSIGLAATAYPTIQLFFGESYASGWLSLVIVSVAVALTSTSVIVTNLLLSFGMTQTVLKASAFGVTIGTVLSALLVSPLGSVGAALGRSALISTSFIFIAYKLKRSFGLYFDNSAFRKSLMCSGTMAIVVVVFTQLVFNSKYMLPLYVAIGGVSYLIMLRLLKAVNNQDIQLFKEIFPSCFHRFFNLFAKFLSHGD